MPILGETFDTEENRFVAFFLDLLLRKVDQLDNLLSRERQRSTDRHAAAETEVITASKKQEPDLKRYLESEESLDDYLHSLQSQLALRRRELRAARRASFLPPQGREPLRPSQRLVLSPEYAPLWRGFCEYKFQAPDLVGEAAGLVGFLDKQPSWAVSNVYEVWTFIKLYERLQALGFKAVPTSDATEEMDPFDIFRPNRKGDKLESSGKVALALKLSTPTLGGVETVRIEMEHEPQLLLRSGARRNPDILMKISLEDLGATKHHHFVIDAKYRDNTIKAKNDPNKTYPNKIKKFTSIFFEDLVLTGYYRYLDALRKNHGVKPKASFILHPDARPLYTFFGETSLDDPDLPFSSEVAENDHPTHMLAHELGSVFVLPTTRGENNLDKLILLFLMYHCGLYDVCWQCRQVVEGKPSKKSDPGGASGVGLAFQCCGEFWVKSHCTSPARHLLIKRRDPFHKTAGSEWKVDCPACSSKLSSVQREAKRGARN